MNLLSTPDELARRIDQPELRLLDVRPASAFAAGHLAHAVHLDLFGVSLRDTRPAPLAAFEWMIQHLFELRGVDRTTPVVVYDETSGMRAARVLWFLRLFGHPDARLLDGGFERWRQDERAIVRDGEEREPGVLVVDRHPEILATVEDVIAALGRRDFTIVDTRSRAEYTGALVRAARGGAIPGAIHLEWTRNLGPDGRYLPADALRAMYAQAGIMPEREVITYCQGGYRAAQTWAALMLAGYPRVRSYLGSWNEWGNRADLPIVRPA
jgi:thiosulfate/3-mercaptopyruvate sulfurtransferase